MKSTTQARYSSRSTVAVAAFMGDLKNIRADLGADKNAGAAILDSIKSDNTAIKLPDHLDKMVGLVDGKDMSRILDSVQIGIDSYTQAHGVAPTADVVEAALQQGIGALTGIDKEGSPLLDNVLNTAFSGHHDSQSLQPNRAVIAIISTIAEAIPFAGYLPVDIRSNEGKLAILQHEAGSTFGAFAAGDLIDGVDAGDVYVSAKRTVKFDISGTAPFASKFTGTNQTGLNNFYCDPAGTGVPLLKGRTKVFVNGRMVGSDSFQGNNDSRAISASVIIAGTSYAISGSVVLSTGVISLSSSPVLPAGSILTAEGIIDYEKTPALIPSVIVRANTFALFANPWRAMTSLSIDAATQITNELGLDANSEALLGIRQQMALERHYQALQYVAAMGANIQDEYDFEWTARSALMNRSQIWMDFRSFVSNIDKKMAYMTMDHGITHMYVTPWVASQFESLGADFFAPSGVPARPSIYRAGRLFGKYEIYVTPKVAYDSVDLSESRIICVGRSDQVARNPVILGDSVSPTFLDLNMLSDLKRNAAIFARDFTELNPHEPSAYGCAIIDVKNLR